MEGDLVLAGAGALDQRVAQEAQRAGLGGLEFLIGIPGTVGGAVRMNAGAFGGETKDRLLWAEALDRHGAAAPADQRRARLCLPPERLAAGLDRRPGRLPGRAGRCRDAVLARMDAIRAEREAAQPLRVADRRQHVQEPARPQGLAADRRRRLPRPAAGCGHGLREALQLPDQHRRRQPPPRSSAWASWCASACASTAASSSNGRWSGSAGRASLELAA